MSAPSRPAKRMRQRLACENCRRKKSRCPGEKPICSFCARLGQNCYYADESVHLYAAADQSANAEPDTDAASRRPSKTEERLKFLESKLAEVLGVVTQRVSQDAEAQPSPAGPSRHEQLPPPPLKEPAAFPHVQLPSWHLVESAARSYLLFCDCQPLPLFHVGTFLTSLRSRDPELLLSILALAMRHSEEAGDPCQAREFAETARKAVMRRVSDGPVQLSTLQCLCLLSLVDFSDGNNSRSNIHSSLAMNLAQCAGLASESPANLSEAMQEERRRCFWSIFLLKRLHGPDGNILDFSGENDFPWYPRTTGLSPSISQKSNNDGNSGGGESKDLGVVAYSIQLSEVWFKTSRYARRRGAPSGFPPWSPQSEYATIVAQTMDFETRMPYRHRYKPSGFGTKTAEDLQSNRAYWAPWLFTQMVYHTNLCLLNHPLILALRLRTFKHSMPEMFLQQTSDLISTHSNWVVHLINTLNEKSFKVGDPFMGHCAAIVATIFLQESFSEDEDVRREKQLSFGKCFDFVRGFASQWPHMARLADKLQRLQDTVSGSYHTAGNPQTPSQGLLVDLGRFWEVLEYSSASEMYESAGQLFGTSLYSRRRMSAVEVTDMSSLPTPTRLEAATGMAQLRGHSVTATPVAQANSHDDAAYMSSLGQDFSNTNFVYPYLAEPTYSNDELAVLADSFFNQRENFIGNVDEWWRNGNL